MQDSPVRSAMRCLLVALLLLAVSVQAYENQQSWLDGSLDADAAMELLERDTDGPVALLETRAHEQAQQPHAQDELQYQHQDQDADFPQAEEHAPQGEALVETEAEAEAGADAVAEAEAETEAGTEMESQSEAESQSQSETEAETEAETETESEEAPVAAAAAAAPVAAAAAPVELDLEAAMPMLMELHAASRAQMSSQAQWRNGPPRRHSRRHSIRAERQALAAKRREDAIYAENLRKLAVRREKWSVPQHLTQAVHAAQAKQLQQHGARKDEEGFMTSEEAQVESLLQLSAKPMVKLHHTNNVHAKLTPELLHGTGLNNRANRAATEAGLAASKDNHPDAPAFIQLPPVGGAPEQHAREFSFVAQKETVRPTYAGPKLAGLPQASARAAPLRAAPKPAAAAPQPAQSVSEAEFVAGLPAEFMELDAATQVKILAMVDAGVDVDAEQKTEAKAQTKTAAQAQAKTAVKAEATAKVAAKAEAKVEAKAASQTEVEESELADAASALRVLAELQKRSHVPFAKLVHLLAKGKQ